MWLKSLVPGMTTLETIPKLQIESQLVTKLAQTPEYHRRTRHIRARTIFVRELVTEGEIDEKRLVIEYHLAVALLKPLHQPRL